MPLLLALYVRGSLRSNFPSNVVTLAGPLPSWVHLYARLTGCTAIASLVSRSLLYWLGQQKVLVIAFGHGCIEGFLCHLAQLTELLCSLSRAQIAQERVEGSRLVTSMQLETG